MMTNRALSIEAMAMRYLRICLNVCLIAGTAKAGDPATTSQPTSMPTFEAIVADSVRQLRSREFAVRESGQQHLTEMGERAVPFLIPYMLDKDAEVAERVARIVGTPKDPRLRVEVAVKLLATTDPDWMERAVYMLFEDPVAVTDLFNSQTREAGGTERVIFEPIAEKLRESKKRHEGFQAKYKEWLKTKPEAAAKMLEMNKSSDLYEAEAAYWTAYEALLSFQESDSSRPVTTSRPTTMPHR